MITMDDGNRSSSRRKRRRGIGEDSRPWSDIPLDVLCNVMRRLTIRDFVCCGAVCASWRSATLQLQYCRPMMEPPWVIPFRYGDSRGVVCPPKRRLHRVPSMPWETIRCSEYLGASNGWLGLQRMESIHILHALSGAVLRLPDLTTIPGVEAIPDSDGEGPGWLGLPFPLRCEGGDTRSRRRRYALGREVLPFFDSIFIVPPPTGSDRDQLTVLALCPLMRRVLFARPGDVAWSFVDMPAPVGNGDIVGFTGNRGCVYAIDFSGRVAVWDYCCSCSRAGGAQADAGAVASGPRFTRIVISSGPPRSARLVRRCLVEEANGDLEEELQATTCGFYETVGVRVFRLEQPGGGEGEGKVGWRRLHHLGHGGTVVFVGRGFSEAFTCRDFPWLERNCIYFTEQFGKFGAPPRELRRARIDSGVYNLTTQKMRAFPSHHRWLHGGWFIPALRSPAAGLLQA